MELSSVQRVTVFAAVVLVLAGLGVYLFLPQSSAAGRPQARSPSASPGPSPTGPQPPAPEANIYAWLPFSQAGLTSAARLVTEFARDYGSYSYRQSDAAYLAPMRPLAAGELIGVIGRAFAAPGVATARARAKQVATATASIVSLRAGGPTSLTFVVQLTQRITESSGHKRQVTDYAVTVTGTGTSWQVSDIELAGAGNL